MWGNQYDMTRVPREGSGVLTRRRTRRLALARVSGHNFRLIVEAVLIARVLVGEVDCGPAYYYLEIGGRSRMLRVVGKHVYMAGWSWQMEFVTYGGASHWTVCQHYD